MPPEAIARRPAPVNTIDAAVGMLAELGPERALTRQPRSD
jgi:hypothetical protein